MRVFLVSVVSAVLLAATVGTLSAQTAVTNLTAPSTKSAPLATVSCAGTATRIACPQNTKAIHVRNNNATTVCFGNNSNVTTTNAAVCRSTTLGLEHSRNATGLYCISAGAAQTVAYECLQ